MNKLNKKIHCFGDSWTHGVGSELPAGSTPISMEEKLSMYHETRKKYSWPGVLQSKTDLLVYNNGDSGISNKIIYERILYSLYSNKIKSGDIVIIMWSSFLREPLNFFNNIPGTNGIQYYTGLQDIAETMDNSWIEIGGQVKPPWYTIPLPQGFSSPNKFNSLFKKITYEAYKNYILNRLNYDFLYEISMNYVCNLQIYFSKLNIDYVFINAFESILSSDHKLYNFINLNKWIMPESNMHYFLWSQLNLIDKNLPYSYWEDNIKDVSKYASGTHPNRIGYSLIANKIYDFMKENNYEI